MQFSENILQLQQSFSDMLLRQRKKLVFRGMFYLVTVWIGVVTSSDNSHCFSAILQTKAIKHKILNAIKLPRNKTALLHQRFYSAFGYRECNTGINTGTDTGKPQYRIPVFMKKYRFS